jgi:hypothetical protein
MTFGDFSIAVVAPSATTADCVFCGRLGANVPTLSAACSKYACQTRRRLGDGANL